MANREPFSEQEVSTLRELVLRGEALTDVSLAQVSSRPPSQLLLLLRRHSALFTAPETPLSTLVSAVNEEPRRGLRHAPSNPSVPPPIDIPVISPATAAIPPKFRGKPITPTTPSASSAQLRSIPIRPRYALSSTAPRNRAPDSPPAIGSLAALLYPDLGPAQVCRVLGETMHNDVKCFLVAFFQPDQSPCYVPGEYLFRLEPQMGLLLDGGDFDRHIASNPVTVDWLLEKIFSSAQNVTVNDADILFPADQVSTSAVVPSPQHVQQLMFQCVSCAALLIICYVAGKWEIPKEKLMPILATILKTNPVKFPSTQAILAQTEERLHELLLG
jgi:hypothetical protein